MHSDEPRMTHPLRHLPHPPPDAPTAALWHAAHSDWHAAHEAAQSDEGAEAAWVHAYLHRVEGDLPNARYWYARAHRPEATGPLDDEWTAIALALAPDQR